jgi:hypothetical protein
VVQFQDNRIPLTAINAAFLREVVVESAPIFATALWLISLTVFSVALTIARIIISMIRGSAAPAVVTIAVDVRPAMELR